LRKSLPAQKVGSELCDLVLAKRGCHAEPLQQVCVAITLRVLGGQEDVADEDGVCAGQEAERLQLVSHVLPSSGEPHHALRHHDAGDRDQPHLRNAAPKLTSAHLARIELALIEADNAETMQDFEAANRAFHHALVAPCAMPRLLASLDGLQLANSRLVFAMARSVGWRPRSNQDHRLILQALRARNVDQACSLLARHIQTIERLAIPAEASSSTAGQ